MRIAGRSSVLGVCSLVLYTSAALAASIGAVPDANAAAVPPKPASLGTQHAPVDGKDGIPHAGPFVETGAARERKQGGTARSDSLNAGTVQTLRDSVDADLIPQSNEGVMDDKTRSSPVDGTRGTEGGVTEKTKPKDGSSAEAGKKPASPKEQLQLPHSEKEKLKDADSGLVLPAEVYASTKPSLAKPTDLPGKSNGLLYTDDQTPSDGHKSTSPSATRLELEEHKDDIVQPFHSMFLAFTMIMVSEIGDKTFLVACLMAMRHDRILVFSAAYGALFVMTVLSAVLGHAVPTLIPKWLTNFLAAGLFLIFGVKMLLEARSISPDEGVSEEMREVEQELEEKEHQALRRSRSRSYASPYNLEAGRGGIRKSRGDGRLPSPPDSPISESSSRAASPSRQSTLKNMTSGVNNLFSLLLSPAWVQTFVMTFLGEWGDRSQIATIAMAAGSDYWWVTAGALVGHAICTGIAVIGGKAIAGKVSLRTVTLAGAGAFLLFGVVYLLEAIY